MVFPPWVTALSWFFTALGLVGNSFVILLISSKKQLLHQATNWFLLSLSFADLGVTLSLTPGEFFCFPSKDACHFVVLALFQWAFLFSSVFNLCMLTLDRYIAIVRPLIYVLFMTKNRVIALICVAWLTSFIFSFLPLTFLYSQHHFITMKNYSYFVVITFELLPTLALVLATAHMIFIAKKHARGTASIEAQVHHNYSGTEDCNTARSRQENRRRSTGVLFIVFIVFFFVFCYSLTLGMTFCHMFQLCQFPQSLSPVKKLLLIANSAFNPFAYGFLKRDVKAEVKQLLRKSSNEGRQWSFQMEQS